MTGQDTYKGRSGLRIPVPAMGRLETGEQSGVLGKQVIAEQTKQLEVDWKLSAQENCFTSVLANLVDIPVIHGKERRP